MASVATWETVAGAVTDVSQRVDAAVVDDARCHAIVCYRWLNVNAIIVMVWIMIVMVLPILPSPRKVLIAMVQTQMFVRMAH